ILSRGLRRVTAGAPLRSCVVATSCHRGRAPLRQTLAVAPPRPAALQRRSFDLPWHTSRAEIVRLRDVPINRDAGEECRRESGDAARRIQYGLRHLRRHYAHWRHHRHGADAPRPGGVAVRRWYAASARELARG